jgi:integrase
MFGDLHSLLRHRRLLTDQVEKKKKMIIPWVFHRNGYPIRDFRKAWEIATEKAKLPNVLIHDLRRSAIKVWTERGISEQHGMELAGHRTPSIYRRYNIVTSDDLKRAVSKLESGIRSTTFVAVEEPAKTGTKQAARGTILGTEAPSKGRRS